MPDVAAPEVRKSLSFDRIAPPAAAAGGFICVGLSIVATRYAIAQSDTLTVAFLRNGLAFVLLFPFLRETARRGPAINIRDRLWISLFGLSSFAAFPLLFTAALRYAPATHGALALPAAAPILTLVFANAAGRERWRLRKVFGMAFAAFGVAVALLDSAAMDGNAGAGDMAWLGDLLMVLAAATIALYNALTRPFLARYGTLKLLSNALGTGAGALLLLVLLRAARDGFGWPQFDRAQWFAIALLAVASALSNWLWSWALSRTTPTRVAVFIALNPIVAMAGAVLFLGERMTIFLSAGLVLVVVGIILVNRGNPGE